MKNHENGKRLGFTNISSLTGKGENIITNVFSLLYEIAYSFIFIHLHIYPSLQSTSKMGKNVWKPQICCFIYSVRHSTLLWNYWAKQAPGMTVTADSPFMLPLLDSPIPQRRILWRWITNWSWSKYFLDSYRSRLLADLVRSYCQKARRLRRNQVREEVIVPPFVLLLYVYLWCSKRVVFWRRHWNATKRHRHITHLLKYIKRR